jgi:hypothetical protein
MLLSVPDTPARGCGWRGERPGVPSFVPSRPQGYVTRTLCIQTPEHCASKRSARGRTCLETRQQTPWQHNHSSTVIPQRPVGHTGLKKLFGKHCSSRAIDGRAWLPSAAGQGVGGYVYFHRRLAPNIAHNILGHIAARCLRRRPHCSKQRATGILAQPIVQRTRCDEV